MATAQALPRCAELPGVLKVPLFHRWADFPMWRYKPERQQAGLDLVSAPSTRAHLCISLGTRFWPDVFSSCLVSQVSLDFILRALHLSSQALELRKPSFWSRHLWTWLAELMPGSPRCLQLSPQTETCLLSGSRFQRCLWLAPYVQTL